MTKILILGGGGMIGQKLAQRIADTQPDAQVDLFDLGFPSRSAPGVQIVGSVTNTLALQNLGERAYDVIYFLASIVSGEAEADFDKGWQTNMFPMWSFLETLRSVHEQSDGTYRPRLVFTSSIAVFGGPYPDKIGDTFLNAPLTSYGAQKATCELMVGDFSRKGFIDGVSIRLPTICVRPGKPNKAASSFFSGIIREPLNGQEAVLPVSPDVRHWHASPRSAAQFLRHAATLDLTRLHNRPGLNLPGVSCTVEEQIEALRAVAGNDVVRLIKHVPDPGIDAIVQGWPRDFFPAHALDLGFRADKDFRAIIETYIEDDLKSSQ